MPDRELPRGLDSRAELPRGLHSRAGLTLGLDSRAELPLGPPVEWSPVPRPRHEPLTGSWVTLRPVTPDDAEDLYAVSHPPDGDPTIWTYLFDGPYRSPEQM